MNWYSNSNSITWTMNSQCYRANDGKEPNRRSFSFNLLIRRFMRISSWISPADDELVLAAVMESISCFKGDYLQSYKHNNNLHLSLHPASHWAWPVPLPWMRVKQRWIWLPMSQQAHSYSFAFSQNSVHFASTRLPSSPHYSESFRPEDTKFFIYRSIFHKFGKPFSRAFSCV